LKDDPRALLRAFDLKPKKRLGQNFLVSRAELARVVESAGLTGSEDVLEIGAGLGTLSLKLADRARFVAVVEIDRELIPVLEWVFSDLQNVRLFQGDILEMDLAQLGLQPGYVVVANIPYNITSHLIRKLMESPFPARRVVLTIQREVAQRITSEPGDMNLLALSVQIFGQPAIEAVIPADAFYPRPSVDSAVIRIDRFEQPLLPEGQSGRFFALARAGFGQRRKQILNALAGGLGLEKGRVASLLLEAGIEPTRRAQELTLEDWLSLTAAAERMG